MRSCESTWDPVGACLSVWERVGAVTSGCRAGGKVKYNVWSGQVCAPLKSCDLQLLTVSSFQEKPREYFWAIVNTFYSRKVFATAISLQEIYLKFLFSTVAPMPCIDYFLIETICALFIIYYTQS